MYRMYFKSYEQTQFKISTGQASAGSEDRRRVKLAGRRLGMVLSQGEASEMDFDEF